MIMHMIVIVSGPWHQARIPGGSGGAWRPMKEGCVYVYMYIHIYIYSMYVCMYICVYIYIYV